MTEPATIRPAASVILWRAGPEVLMGQRGAKAAFMPSKYVFPGGGVDATDHSAGHLTAPCFARLTQHSAVEPEALTGCALRELTEETGYVAGKITKLTDWLVSPGVMNERMYLYLCEDLRPGPTDHQPDENLEPVVVPWSEALAMATDGRIEDPKTMLAILLCDRLFRKE